MKTMHNTADIKKLATRWAKAHGHISVHVRKDAAGDVWVFSQKPEQTPNGWRRKRFVVEAHTRNFGGREVFVAEEERERGHYDVLLKGQSTEGWETWGEQIYMTSEHIGGALVRDEDGSPDNVATNRILAFLESQGNKVLGYLNNKTYLVEAKIGTCYVWDNGGEIDASIVNGEHVGSIPTLGDTTQGLTAEGVAMRLNMMLEGRPISQADWLDEGPDIFWGRHFLPAFIAPEKRYVGRPS